MRSTYRTSRRLGLPAVTIPAFKALVAYDGGAFAGWQRQPGRRTVQGEMERALEKVLGRFVCVVASGRTDTGVHALGQVVSFECETRLDVKELCKALNSQLPEDILVFQIDSAPPRFHAQRHAVRKRYRYVLQDGGFPDIFERNYSWRVYHRLDVAAMASAAALLVGEHDFASFQTGGSMRLTTVRTIYDLLVERRAGERTDRIVVEVESNGFLYNMVRNIVGTLVEIGRGRKPVEWMADVLAQRDRRAAGMVAPPQGLFLVQVWYDDPPVVENVTSEPADAAANGVDARCDDLE